MKLGTCYYPEHWPEEQWPDDARDMAEMGLSRIRIGEFAWSRIEPQRGQFDWDWLDKAIATLADQGLEIILGTPTATPPKWLVDEMPDMLACDRFGNPRGFGSRRHYCFSHRPYREECARIVQAMAERYGEHAAVVAWQTDNEFGCHNTTLSYSAAARDSFRRWLAERYEDVGSLNRAWGNVFWSMEYRSFDEVELPNLTVTEPNPAHVLDFRRFASDEVASFHHGQAEILREHSPGRDVVHNFMGFVTDFDHHKLGADCDVAMWDSYPLGFTESYWFNEDAKLHYARQGHPDIAGFHHDLYRGCSNGRWGIIEQQPGPVNWAAWNPAPLPGMVRLWTLEAMAHGAELVSYFRWRQAPFAQEQMHTGLHTPDGARDQGGDEAVGVAREIAGLGRDGKAAKAPIALVFSYEAQWVIETQPQGRDFSYIQLAFAMYSALRRLGFDIDIVSPTTSLEGYAMAVVPSLPVLNADAIDRLGAFDGALLIGPRTGSKGPNMEAPQGKLPGLLRELMPLEVLGVESLRPGLSAPGGKGAATRWFEHVSGDCEPVMQDGDAPILWRHGHRFYCNTWPDDATLRTLLDRISRSAGLTPRHLPADLRLRGYGDLTFAFNYGPEMIHVGAALGEKKREFVIGKLTIPPAGVAAWRDVPG